MSRLDALRGRLAPPGSLRAGVLTLLTGAALGQLLLLAVSPALTRLYAPAAFGAFGVYLSLAAILGALATLRFDQALMLPGEPERAAPLFWAALLSAGVLAALALVAGLFGRMPILAALRSGELGGWLFLLPVSLLFGGAVQVLNAWTARRQRFGCSALAQAGRGLAIAAVQVLGGALCAGPGGLAGGMAAGDAVASLVLFRRVWREDGPLLKGALNWRRIRQAAGEYREFPLYSGPQNFLNAVSQNVPLLLLAKFFGAAEAGFYLLAVRAIQLPLNFFLNALRQAFFPRASELHRRGGDAWGLFRQTTLRLLALVLPPALLVFLLGPRLFAWVFGDGWLTAGVYARWLIPWLALMFANVPAVIFAQILRRQRAMLLLDVALLAARILALAAGGWRGEPLLAVVLYGLVGAAVNLGLIGWVGALLWREARR